LGLQHLQALRDADMRLALARDAVRRDRSGARSAGLLVGLMHAAEVLLQHGEIDDARVAWKELKDLASHSHDVTVAVWANIGDSIQSLLAGELDQAIEIFEAANSAAEAVGIRTFAGRAAHNRALIYLGRTAAIEAIVATSRPRFRPEQARRADFLAHLGRAGEALVALREFQGIESDDDASGLFILAWLLEVSVLAGDAATARALSRRLAPLAQLVWTQGLCSSIGRLLGGAAMLLGEPENARGFYGQALAACEKIHFRPELALIHLELAELLLTHYPDERTAALAHLDFAIGELREMKMQPALERALRHKDVLKA